MKTTSAAPNTVRWPISIAGTDTESGYGQYIAFPAESRNSIGWIPNSMAAQSAAALMPTYEPIPAAIVLIVCFLPECAWPPAAGPDIFPSCVTPSECACRAMYAPAIFPPLAKAVLKLLLRNSPRPDSALSTRRYTAYPTNGSTKAMLKQFAPKLRMPPSPKRNACTSSAMLIDIHAAYGPSATAIIVPPTA